MERISRSTQVVGPRIQRDRAPVVPRPRRDAVELRRLDPGPRTGVIDHQQQLAREGLTLENTPASLARELAVAGLEQGVDRDGIHALLESFRTAADQRAMLEALFQRSPGAAETVALFGRRGPKSAKDAFLHYVINTGGVARGLGGTTNHLIERATEYARGLGFDSVKRRGDRLVALQGRAETELMRWTPELSGAELLRALGRRLNTVRYGVEQIVPPAEVELELDRTTYSDANAYWSAQMASLAYADPATIEAQARAWGFNKFRWIEDRKTDTQAFVVSNGHATFVTFRGTSSLADFRIDAKFLKTEAHGGRVHRGFNRAAESVWPSVERALKELAPNRPVLFSGHSLGAATASLAAMNWSEKGGNVGGVYLFGCPRAGDADFVERYDELLGEKTFLHVNDADVVPRVPPDWVGYAELGRERRHFDSAGDRTVVEIPKRHPAVVLEALEAPPDHAELEREHQRALEAIFAGAESHSLHALHSSHQGTAHPDAVLEAFFPRFAPIADHGRQNYVRLTGQIVLERLLGAS